MAKILSKAFFWKAMAWLGVVSLVSALIFGVPFIGWVRSKIGWGA